MSFAELMKIRRSVSEADFLFGPEISKYIDEIFDHIVKLQFWDSQYRDYTQHKPADYDHQKVCDGIHSAQIWLAHQFAPSKEIFRKYLTLDDNCFIRIQHNARRFRRQLREFLTSLRAKWSAVRKK